LAVVFCITTYENFSSESCLITPLITYSTQRTTSVTVTLL
jgi:hypothetical protein